MNNIGLARNNVALAPHNEKWADIFRQEAEAIRSVVQDKLISVEHIGSTAIPHVDAKPIIDIAICYPNREAARLLIEPLTKIGYEYKGEEGVAGRYFFTKGPESNRHFYLHLIDQDEFARVIHFRDKLIHDPVLARQYSNLKHKLQEKFAHDRKSYTNGKDGFISEVLSQ